MQPIFITGIGTGIGKTLIAAIITEALRADYWKPVQAGFDGGTDSEWIKQQLSNPVSKIHPEKYKLEMPASPHIAAREGGITISLDKISGELTRIKELGKTNCVTGVQAADILIIEGAGGLMVPLNEEEFILDLVKKLNAKVILVSRNYLGSINHSLLTSMICRQHSLDVIGWIFNDQYLSYEEEIVKWSGLPKIASVPFSENPGREFVRMQAETIRPPLLKLLERPFS